MKDFQEIIDQSQGKVQVQVEKQEEGRGVSRVVEKVLPWISPFLLSVVTGPLATAAMLLQLTPKGTPSPTVAKVKAQPQLKRHILNGLYGENRIYQPPTVLNYKDSFGRLGREGLRGLYKGNLTGILLVSSNAWVRGQLYSKAGEGRLLGEGMLGHLTSKLSC